VGYARSRVPRFPVRFEARRRPLVALRLAQRLGAEAQKDRLDDRGVVEHRVRHRAWLDPQRDDQRWHAHAAALEHLRVTVGSFGRRDVVEEAAVLVVDDDQQRLLPSGPRRERVVDGEHQLLAVLDIGRCVVVVGLKADRVEVAEVRVDPGDRWQPALSRVLDEARRQPKTSPEPGSQGTASNAVIVAGAGIGGRSAAIALRRTAGSFRGAWWQTAALTFRWNTPRNLAE